MYLRRCGLAEHSNERIGHPRRDALDVVLADLLARGPVATRQSRQAPAGWIEAGQTRLPVQHGQTRADLHRRRVKDIPTLDQGQFRGASTDIDVEHRCPALARRLGRARAIRGKHGLRVVTGRHPEKLLTPLPERIGDRRDVLPTLRLTCEHNGTGVYGVRIDVGEGVGLVDEAADGLAIDMLLADVRGQHDRRLIHRLVACHTRPTRRLFRESMESHAGEHHLSARGTDVDPDRQLRTIVLDPRAGRDRIVLATDIGLVVVRARRIQDIGHVHRSERRSAASVTRAPPSCGALLPTEPSLGKATIVPYRPQATRSPAPGRRRG